MKALRASGACARVQHARKRKPSRSTLRSLTDTHKPTFSSDSLHLLLPPVQRLSGAAAGLVRGGPVELVQHFVAQCNARTQHHLDALLRADEDEVAATGGSSSRSADLLRSGIHFRLEQVAPHASNWREAMSLSADPRHAPASLRQLAELSDLLCSATSRAKSVGGENAAEEEPLSTAREWESGVLTSVARRALVGGIYTSAEVFLVQDESVDLRDTWDFVERRLDELGDVSTTLDGATDVAAALGAGAASLGTILSSLSFDDTTRWTKDSTGKQDS